MTRRFIFLAKLGVIESNDEKGEYQIQRIDDPENFAHDNELNFVPPKLKSDDEAEAIFKSLTHNHLELDKCIEQTIIISNKMKTTYIVLIPLEYNINPRVNCEAIENVTYVLDNITAHNVLLEVNKDLEHDEPINIEVEPLTDFMDRVNDEMFNADNYFISYVHAEQKQ